MEAEGLGKFFINSRKGTRRAAENLASKIVGNPISSLELAADLSTVSKGNPGETNVTATFVLKFIPQGDFGFLGKIQQLIEISKVEKLSPKNYSS